MDNQLLTTSQVAIRLCVTSMSVRRYIDAGLISYVLTAGGHYRIPLSEVERLIEQGRNAPTRKTRRRYDAIHITEADLLADAPPIQMGEAEQLNLQHLFDMETVINR